MLQQGEWLAVPEAAPTAQQVRIALDELTGWPEIARSPQLADLLRYVVEKSLNGEQAAIKAYAIAVDVFGRPQNFDPQSDPIVRVQARRLRALIDQYYSSGQSRCGVQIRMPIGRYVPEFVAEKPPDSETVAPGPESSNRGEPQATRGLSGLLVPMLVGLVFTLVGVVLAVSIVRWTSSADSPVVEVPNAPVVWVGPFENATGGSSLDEAVHVLEGEVREGLGLFENMAVSRTQPDFVLTAVLQGLGPRLELRPVLTQARTGRIVWSKTLTPDPETAGPERPHDLAKQLVRQLASARGPLYAAGRLWVTQQTILPSQPNDYVCRLKYEQWRDTRLDSDALDAIECLQQLIDRDSRDGLALAASASIASWRTMREAGPGDQLVALLLPDQRAVEEAVALLPRSSFVRMQQAVVLARQGSVEAALGAIATAVELNPNNVDAISTQGLFVSLTGDWERGAALSDEALKATESPSPILYAAPALNALREGRYKDAVELGQSLSAGEAELGPVVVLAAATLAQRADLIERYRAMVLGNPQLQANGVLLGLNVYLRQDALVQRVRDGLLMAGLPPNVLDWPFNPDGTERQ